MRKGLTKIDLHARLKKHAFEHAIITTYSFGASFLEDYALANLNALQDNGNISILVDEREYQDLLDAAEQKTESFPKHANLRYLLHPVGVPGAFHPKIFLFAGKRRGLLIIGSANFTLPGLGSNAELVAAFDYEEDKDEAALPVFQAAMGFFEQVAARWPSDRLELNLNTLKTDVLWLSKTSDHISREDLPVLLSNLERPLWEQLVERLPKPAQELSVLSPYFDAQPALLKHVMNPGGIPKVIIYTQNGTTTLTSSWLEAPAFLRGDLRIRLCSYSDEEHYQKLHGKAYAFDCGRETFYAFGSANFSTPALRRTAHDGNLEVLLCYPPVSGKPRAPEAWFDPDESAVELKNASELITSAKNPDEREGKPKAFSVHLTEALVDEDSLKLKTASSDLPKQSMCQITQGNTRPFILRLNRSEAGTIHVVLDPAQQKRLHDAPAIAQLGTQSSAHWTPLSNPLLISNLQDFVTGRDLRRERQLREARESPQRFMDVLTALSQGDDEERLKQFLTYCDIPIDLTVRLFQRRHLTAEIDGARLEVFRVLGLRNLRHFEVLHDAVVDFIRRHRRRLDQHIERGTVKGIPNFLHILLTMGSLLLSQIERVVAGLKVETTVQMTPDRWAQIRNQLAIYYLELFELLQRTAVDYLDAMIKSSTRAKVRAEFGDNLQKLVNLYDQAMKDRDVIDALQRSHLEIVTLTRHGVGPGFFNTLLADDSWSRFQTRIRNLQVKLAERIAS